MVWQEYAHVHCVCNQIAFNKAERKQGWGKKEIRGDQMRRQNSKRESREEDAGIYFFEPNEEEVKSWDKNGSEDDVGDIFNVLHQKDGWNRVSTRMNMQWCNFLFLLILRVAWK